jgi:hypothetical protein
MRDKDNSDEQKSGPNNSEPQLIVTENNRSTRSQNNVENNQAKPRNREPLALIIWTAILALGTVALGCAAIWNDFLIGKQLHEMRKASVDTTQLAEAARKSAEAADAANNLNTIGVRPWIKVKPQISGPLDLSSGLGILPIDFTLINVGRSPAFNIQLGVWGFLGFPGQIDLFTEQKERCERLRHQPLDNPARGMLLFPGERRNENEAAFGGSLVPGISETDIRRSGIASSKKELDIWTYGCADYTFGVGEIHHQTGFVYRLGRVIDRPGMNAALTFGIDPSTLIPADHLELYPSPSASGQTD